MSRKPVSTLASSNLERHGLVHGFSDARVEHQADTGLAGDFAQGFAGGDIGKLDRHALAHLPRQGRFVRGDEQRVFEDDIGQIVAAEQMLELLAGLCLGVIARNSTTCRVPSLNPNCRMAT